MKGVSESLYERMHKWTVNERTKENGKRGFEKQKVIMQWYKNSYNKGRQKLC